MRLIEFLRRHPVLAFLLFCLIPAEGFAQVTTGDVLGTVEDPSGAIVTKADITLTNSDTGAIRTLHADANGSFIFTALLPGNYDLKIESAGFNPLTIKAIHVNAGDRVREIATLPIANGSETVDVVGNIPVLQTDTSKLETAIRAQQLEELPLNGRNFMQLAQLALGANEANENALPSGQRPDDRRQTSSISANGQSDTLNQQLVDGIDNNEGSVGTIGIRPSVDLIGEVHVFTGNYPAEAGKTAGAIVNVITRGGTNRVHGSAFEFFRNQATDARNFFARTGPKPALHQNQFGGSIGGPIQRNKTFFFGGYEGYRQKNNSITYNNVVPTAYQQQHPGDFSDVGGPVLTSPNAVALKFFALYPLPNTTGTATTGTYTYSPTNTQNSDIYDGRIDHHFNDDNQIFARYAQNQVDTFIAGTMPAVNGIEPGGSATFPGPSFQRAQQFMLNYLHIVSPQTLLEFKAGYTHLLNRTLPLTYGQPIGNQFGIVGSNYDAFSTMMPFLNITGYAGFGGADSLPLFNGTNTFQYSASITHTSGRHTVKAGAIFLRRQIFNQQNAAANSAGSYAFNGQYSATVYPTAPSTIRPLIDLLAGRPYTTRRVAQVYPRYPRYFEPSAYVQDDYRVTKTLTLNLGLRWDMWTPLKEKSGHISMFSTDTNAIAVANVNASDTLGVHTDYTSIAPRVGFAWNAHPTTVVRGAYGLTYFRDNNGPSVPFADPPYTFVYTPGALTTNLSDPLPLPSAQSITNLTGAVRGVDPNFKNSRADQYHLDVQQQIGGTVYTIGYVGMRVRHLKISPDINLAHAQPNSTIPGCTANPTNPACAVNDYQTRRPYYANGMYPNLNASINIFRSQGMSNYNALQLSAVHAYSHGLTAQANYTWAHAMSDTQAFSQSVLFSTVDNTRFHQLEYSNSDLDQRHRFTLMLNYKLPFGESLRGVTRTVLYGWQVNAIDVWGTGLPFTVTNSTARTNTGASSDRPNQVADARIANAGIHGWFNTAAFQAQTFGTIGSARRTSVYGPPLRHFDMSLFKIFTLHEDLKMQLRAEAYNLTNTPNFSTPGATLGTSTFGTITQTRLGSTPRQYQFAARFTF